MVVMKDEDLKFEEIEVSHTIGGTGRCYSAVIHTYTSVSRT